MTIISDARQVERKFKAETFVIGIIITVFSDSTGIIVQSLGSNFVPSLASPDPPNGGPRSSGGIPLRRNATRPRAADQPAADNQGCQGETEPLLRVIASDTDTAAAGKQQKHARTTAMPFTAAASYHRDSDRGFALTRVHQQFRPHKLRLRKTHTPKPVNGNTPPRPASGRTDRRTG